MDMKNIGYWGPFKVMIDFILMLICPLGELLAILFVGTQFSSVAQSCLTLRQASLSITKPMSTVSVMPSNHLILCHLLLLASIFSSIRVFSNESALHIRWPKYWSFSFNISPSNEHPGLISSMMD